MPACGRSGRWTVVGGARVGLQTGMKTKTNGYEKDCLGITVPENRLFVKPTFRFFFMSQAPAGGRRTVVGGARVVSGAAAPKKNHLIEAAPFGRLDQM